MGGKFAFAALVFFLSALAGFMLESHAVPIPLEQPGYRWSDYFAHNLRQSLIVIAAGTATYGLGGYILLAVNGFAAGVGLQLMIQNGKADLIWKAFLPHAVFEIPAILISSVLPFMIWKSVLTFRRNRAAGCRLLIRRLLPTFGAMVALFAVAAVMEHVFAGGAFFA